MQEDILVEILMGRKTCSQCSRSYHFSHIDRNGYYMQNRLPKKSLNRCDDCDGILITRDDDKEEPIKTRMALYTEKTEPILDFYRKTNQTKVIDFEPKRGTDDFYKVKRLLGPLLI